MKTEWKVLVVDIVGQSGGGKSTLLPLVADYLRLISKDVEIYIPVLQRTWFFLYTTISNPFLLNNAWIATKHMSGKFTGLNGYISCLRRFSYYVWNKNNALNLRDQMIIQIFDEGTVQLLRNIVNPVSAKLLARMPLPNMVVNIQTDWIQAAWRRVLRSKPVMRNKIFKGNSRKPKASSIAKNFLRKCSEKQTMEYLLLWSEKFCSPALSAEELDVIILNARKKTSDSSTLTPSEEWLRPALEDLDIYWIDVDTSDGNPPEKTSKFIAEQIWEFYCSKYEKQV